MSFLSTATAIASVTMSLATAPMPASDHGVYNAYRSHHHLLKADVKKYYRAEHRLLTGGFATDGEVEDFVDADGQMNVTLKDVQLAVKDSRAKTHAGAQARRSALREISAWKDANTNESKALLAAAHYDRAGTQRYLGRMDAAATRLHESAVASRKWFRKAGFHATINGLAD